MMKRRTNALWLLLFLKIGYLCKELSAFSILPTDRILGSPRSVVALYATSRRKRGGGVAKRTGGGGFGGQKTKASTNSNKIRSLSGFRGSGTKELRQATNIFDELKKEYGPEACADVYVRSPLNDKQLFWFVGKVGRCLKSEDLVGSVVPTVEEAAFCQKRLILEYAKQELRPQNLGGPFSEGLELWLAPADSEMACVQNQASLAKVNITQSALPNGLNVKDVGYSPEIYVGEERRDGGLRVRRDENGAPFETEFEVNHSV